MMERERQPNTLLSAVRHAAVLLVFLAMVAQMAASDLHVTAMPMDATDAQMHLTALPCTAMCGSAILHICLPASRVCAAVVATFTHAPVFALLALALIVLIAVAATPRSRIVASLSWLWPPDRRRALLQVFLI